MVRISDILKNQEGAKKKEEPSKPPTVPSETKPKRPESKEAQAPASNVFSFSNLRSQMGGKPPPTVAPPPVSPGDYVTQAIKGSEVSRQETAASVYNKALALAQTILEKAQTGEEIRGKEIQEVIQDVIRELLYDNCDLLDLACCQVVEEGTPNFMAADMVNKTILAVEIGVGKKMNKSKLFQLGMSAFFSEIGIVQMLDVATKKEALTEEEKSKIRDLPNQTVQVLKKIPDLNQVVLTVAKESKERCDASGPLGIKDLKQLDEFSRIVAVIDVFESLTHDRPYRKHLMPHEAMKTILEEGGKFESEVVRLLVDLIGIYPIGSWVRLTTKEIAKVVGSNPGRPLCPKIKVMFDEHGEMLEEPQALDLAKVSSIHVSQPVSDEELKKLIKGKP